MSAQSTETQAFYCIFEWQGLRFNHVILVDVAHFPDGDTVHVIDAATSYQAAKYTDSVQTPDASQIWAAIKECWMNQYIGPPDVLRFDQGSAMISAFLQTACALNGIKFEAIPTEAPWRIGAVERAHAPLRLAYTKLRADLPTMGRDELCP